MNTLYGLIMVFVGGGLGSLCRYGIAKAVAPYEPAFPYATLIANILACIVLGYLTVISENLSLGMRLLLLTGFCGGFSTFSTFSSETFQLFQQGLHLQAFTNIVGSVVICLGAIYVGMLLGKH